MSSPLPGAGHPTLGSIIEHAALCHRDRPAIIAEETWCFRRLEADATALARVLGGLGVRRGDRVALRLASSGRALVLLAAIARAGASAVPFDIATPPSRLAALSAAAGVRLTVDGPAALAALFDADPSGPAPQPAGPHDEAYVIHTSGSAGAPKGVSVAQAAIAAHADHARAYFGLTEADRILQFASLGFDVSQEEIWPSWAAGAAVVVNPVWLPDTAELARITATRGVTVLQLPTAYWRTIIAEPRDPASGAFAGVRLVVVGGEAVRAGDLAAHGSSVLGHAELVNGYGPTETVVTSVAWRLPAGAAGNWQGPVPIGTAFPGRVTAVVRADGTPAGPGDEGELRVSGLLADGYVNQPDLTSQRFAEPADDVPVLGGQRWYATGDQVLVLPDGQLAFAGRLDDQVKLRGYRIELGEVDSALRDTGLVTDAAAALVERDGAEPLLGALVVPKDAFQAADLAAALGDRLPAPFVPVAWAQAAAIPLTPSGKVSRAACAHAIAAAEAGGPVAAGPRPGAAPGDATLLGTLTGIWREVLGTEEADPTSDFFGLGGDSLLAVRFSVRARAQGIIVRPADVVRNATLGGIAVAAQWQDAVAPAGPPETGIALLPAQYRWLLDGAIADVHHFLVSALLRLPPDVPDAALVDVAAVLLSQHTALSSQFNLAEPAVSARVRDPASVVTVIDVDSPQALRSAATGVKASLSPAAGHVFRLVRLRAGGRHWLLIVVHHLVLDGWSMALLVDEVDAALTRRLQSGRATLDPPTRSVAQVRAAVDGYLLTDQARRDARTWLDAPWSDLAAVPGRRAGGGLLPSVTTSRHPIPVPDTTTILRRLPASAGRPVDLLTSAIFVAMAEWTGSPAWAIDVYASQRAAAVGGIDVSRTIGYLQSTHPEIGVVRGAGAQAVLALLAARRYAPPNLFSFDALRFLSPVAGEREALAALPRSPLRLNYRSQLSRLEQRPDNGPLTDADEDTGPDRARSQSERYDLMFEGDVIDGEFVVGAKYSTDHFSSTEIDTLTKRVAALMTAAAGQAAS
jgi:amino acid adenylation domain-containing protein